MHIKLSTELVQCLMLLNRTISEETLKVLLIPTALCGAFHIGGEVLFSLLGRISWKRMGSHPSRLVTTALLIRTCREFLLIFGIFDCAPLSLR